jgi:hypothetical protein
MNNSKIRHIDIIIESMTKKDGKTTDTVNNILNDKIKFRTLISASNIQNVGVMRMYLENMVQSA